MVRKLEVNPIPIGGFKSSEKYEFVNWDDEIPNIWESKKCSKPPTSTDIEIDHQMIG